MSYDYHYVMFLYVIIHEILIMLMEYHHVTDWTRFGKGYSICIYIASIVKLHILVFLVKC